MGGSDADATLAVVAHGLLNAMHVVISSLSTLVELGDGLSAADRTRFLTEARAQATLVAGILQDLVRGLPDATFDLLEHLREEEVDD